MRYLVRDRQSEIGVSLNFANSVHFMQYACVCARQRPVRDHSSNVMRLDLSGPEEVGEDSVIKWLHRRTAKSTSRRSHIRDSLCLCVRPDKCFVAVRHGHIVIAYAIKLERRAQLKDIIHLLLLPAALCVNSTMSSCAFNVVYISAVMHSFCNPRFVIPVSFSPGVCNRADKYSLCFLTSRKR